LFINNCCVSVVDDGCPIVVHCFPPPIDPNKDVEFEFNDDGTVETPPLLFTCKYDDGVEADDELAVDAKCR